MEKKNIESLPTLAKVESMENIKIGHFDQNAQLDLADKSNTIVKSNQKVNSVANLFKDSSKYMTLNNSPSEKNAGEYNTI